MLPSNARKINGSPSLGTAVPLCLRMLVPIMKARKTAISSVGKTALLKRMILLKKTGRRRGTALKELLIMPLPYSRAPKTPPKTAMINTERFTPVSTRSKGERTSPAPPPRWRLIEALKIPKPTITRKVSASVIQLERIERNLIHSELVTRRNVILFSRKRLV